MKRFIALVLSLVMTLSLCAPAWAAASPTDLEGTGTETDPWVVTTESELADMLEEDGYIKLGAGFTATNTLTVPAGVTVTLDLNGKTLSYTSTEAKASCAINNKGTLTIKNGTVTYEGVGDPSFGYGTNTINNTGKLTIDGASIINTTTSGSSVAIDCSAGAELLVKSGEIISEKNAIRLCPFGAAAINCTIDGGTITGARGIQIQLPSNKPADAPDVNLTVNDGTLNGRTGLSIYSYSDGQSFANVDVTLNGGIYSNDVAFGGGTKATVENVTITGGTYYCELGRYLANDGWEDLAPVTLGNVKYGKLQDAINAIREGGTMHIKDDGMSAVVNEAKSFTVICPEGVSVNIKAGDGFILTVADDVYTVKAVVAKIGNVDYASLQEAVDAVVNDGTIDVKVGGMSATVKTAKSFTLTGKDATINAAKGYRVIEGNGKYTVEKIYTVKFDANNGSGTMKDVVIVAGGQYQLPNCTFNAPEGKQFKGWGATANATELLKTPYIVNADATLYAIWENVPVVEVEEDVLVQVAPPVVTVSDKITGEAAEIAKEVEVSDICTDAMTEVVKEMAEQDKTEAENHIDDLNAVLTEDVAVEDIVVVVQTNFEVKIENVTVNNDGTATVKLDITPVYQKVITTKAAVLSGETIKTGDNAVALKAEGASGELDLKGEEVEITVVLPEFAGKDVYVKHEAEKGVVLHKATADANGKLTFKTKSGFSPFTFSLTEHTIAASVEGGDNYADLQSAVNYMGKDATVTVKAKDQSAVVNFATTFTVKYENGATKDNTKITAAPGYYLTTKDVTGGVQYTVSRAYYGGYVGGTTATPDKVVTSAKTFDAGIGLYVAMSVMAAAGSAVVLKKRED